MKRLLVSVTAFMLMSTPVMAHETFAKADHTHNYVDTNTEGHEFFDYGVHLDVEKVVSKDEKKSVLVGLHNTYFQGTNELRSTVGLTIIFE